MKVKLYKKVIKASWKTLLLDERPSGRTTLQTILGTSQWSTQFTRQGVDKKHRDAIAGFIVWTSKNIDGSSRYDVKEKIREQFKDKSRKWWKSSAVLKRIIERGEA